MTLFEEYPPREKAPPRPWKPTALQARILGLLVIRGPMGDQQIIMALLDEAMPGRVLDALNVLGRKGQIVDTGERGEWTTRGRSIIWRSAS